MATLLPAAVLSRLYEMLAGVDVRADQQVGFARQRAVAA